MDRGPLARTRVKRSPCRAPWTIRWTIGKGKDDPMKRKGPWQALAFAAVFACSVVVWAAEKTEAERAEDAEAAEEERKLEEAGRIPNDGYEFSGGGRLLLSNGVMDPERPGVLGVFRTKARVYLVKVDEEALRGKLAKFNGKMVTLGGKIRNGGKYLVVQEVLSQPGGLAPAANTSPARM